ncbi:hypothetical protein BH23ACT2_BH23ACT2_11200 [soil metagenome]
MRATTIDVVVTGGPAVEQVDEIRLTLPALAEYARVARLAVTGVAARIGFTYDEMEDLRIAVGEVSGLLPGHDGARVTYRCAVVADAVFVETTVAPPEPSPPAPALSRQILDAVSDHVELDLQRARVLVMKRRRG